MKRVAKKEMIGEQGQSKPQMKVLVFASLSQTIEHSQRAVEEAKQYALDWKRVCLVDWDFMASTIARLAKPDQVAEDSLNDYLLYPEGTLPSGKKRRVKNCLSSFGVFDTRRVSLLLPSLEKYNDVVSVQRLVGLEERTFILCRSLERILMELQMAQFDVVIINLSPAHNVFLELFAGLIGGEYQNEGGLWDNDFGLIRGAEIYMLLALDDEALFAQFIERYKEAAQKIIKI